MGIDKAPIYLVSKLWSTTSCPLLLIHEWCAIRNRMLIVLTRLIAKNTRVAYWNLLSLPSNISFHQLVRIIIEIKKLIMKRKRTISWIPIHEWIIRWHFSLSHFHENIYIYIHIQFSSNVSFKSFKSKSFKIVLWSDSTIHSLYYLSNGVRIQKVQFQPQFPSHRLWHTRKTIHRATNACNNKLPRLT